MAAWKDTAYPADQAELYRLMDAQLGALMEGERDALPNMANASALIYHALENVNWAGFYLYRQGIGKMQYSYTTAAGLFQSGIGMILILITNKIAHMMGERGIW